MNTQNISFEQYLPSYSVQAAGPRARILVTQQGTTTTLVTVDHATADKVAAQLGNLADARTQVLHLHARRNPGEVSYYRRNLMSALLAGAREVSAGAGVEPLLAAAASCTDAERRAIADEVGRLFDGTEDVIVPCYVEDGTGEASVLEIANGWLYEELRTGTPDALANILTELLDGESGWLYEGLLAHLRGMDNANGELIDDIADRAWVDVSIDERSLAAWVRRNLPATGQEGDALAKVTYLHELIDELEDNDDLAEFTAGEHLLARFA